MARPLPSRLQIEHHRRVRRLAGGEGVPVAAVELPLGIEGGELEAVLAEAREGEAAVRRGGELHGEARGIIAIDPALAGGVELEAAGVLPVFLRSGAALPDPAAFVIGAAEVDGGGGRGGGAGLQPEDDGGVGRAAGGEGVPIAARELRIGTCGIELEAVLARPGEGEAAVRRRPGRHIVARAVIAIDRAIGRGVELQAAGVLPVFLRSGAALPGPAALIIRAAEIDGLRRRPRAKGGDKSGRDRAHEKPPDRRDHDIPLVQRELLVPPRRAVRFPIGSIACGQAATAPLAVALFCVASFGLAYATSISTRPSAPKSASTRPACSSRTGVVAVPVVMMWPARRGAHRG